MSRNLRSTLIVACSLGVIGCLHAPMPWSPDSQWIAYSVEVRPTERILRPGWLFEPPTRPLVPPEGVIRPTAYRLWATRKDNGTSVLLEESANPLTAPGWSPDGRSLAFGRLAVQPDGSTRFEVVLLDGPARRRVISSRPVGEINVEAARLPGQAIAWSPDGRFLAIPQLNPAGLAIIRADNGRQVNAINDAFLPSWSPDGGRLAFYLRGTGDTLNCLDSPLGQPRMLLEVGQGSQAPIWTKDGLTLLVSTRKSIPRGAEPPGDQVELARVRVDTGQSETLRSLSTDAVLGRDRSLEGVSIAFDGENLFCSTVVEGGPQVVTWYHPRENEVYKKFPLLDITAPMGSLSASPDGTTLAARVGAVDRLGAPVLCDLESPDLRCRLIAPDDSSRVEWIASLVTSARLILSSLPTPSLDPRSPSSSPVERPTLLPILGEFESNSEATARLRRIGKLGRPLCQRPPDAPAPDPAVAELIDEARLFFEYLSENYGPALQALETLEARVETPDRRARLLSVRAQIFLAQGQFDRASKTVEFLRDLGPKPARRVEWDGSSYVLTGVETPGGSRPGWPSYLGWRVSKVREQLQEDVAEGHFNPDAPRPNVGFEPFNLRGLPMMPERPFFLDPIPPQDPANRPGSLPRPRMPVR